VWCNSTTPSIWKRTTELLKDGDDDFAFLMCVEGEAVRTQLGRGLDIRAGDGFGILQNETASLEYRELSQVTVLVPRAALAPLVPNIEGAAVQAIRRETPALRLLQAYLAALRKENGIADSHLRRVVSNNIRDLVAVVVGAGRDGEVHGNGRGVRAARLQAMKSEISENPGLRLAELAKRQRVTPRYVQMLFEEDGTTFTNYVLEQRLRCAHAMLVDIRRDHWTIGAIAFHAGFGDLSYFNRKFKDRFGATPSQIRVEAQRAR
jgi:AraC-like DNA-binding protein